ncbi:hypothetical protein GCM10025771_15310 [Niveibacterium umoris]|uniref:SAM-dependent methyltransferase n=1 Tax=Niveibacterium umoris TaxID=1193620 RepID=A0A840BPL0_9RHOO|nr:class I SAM-dependent methyltransferase [Niveibacterium umoris]MBB4014594.1 SAM-dependent methyltransferase [Niveibacterium umoris]
MKLDLACGQRKREGFLGVDIAACEGVDTVFDLRTTPWPWADQSVEEVWCSHFFEHLDGDERIAFMHELWRVLVPDGKATIITPYWASMRAIQDPTHKWPPVCESSYAYFNKPWRDVNKLNHYPIHCDFDFTHAFAIDREWASRDTSVQWYAARHLQNTVNDLVVTLTRRSGR